MFQSAKKCAIFVYKNKNLKVSRTSEIPKTPAKKLNDKKKIIKNIENWRGKQIFKNPKQMQMFRNYLFVFKKKGKIY